MVLYTNKYFFPQLNFQFFDSLSQTYNRLEANFFCLFFLFFFLFWTAATTVLVPQFLYWCDLGNGIYSWWCLKLYFEIKNGKS